MKKIGLLLLTLVLALGALGVGYAMWDKTLGITGTVNTGEVNMRIVSISQDDEGIDLGTLIDGVTPKDKDVGWTVVQIDPNDNQKGIVTVHNAYPCYENYVHFSAHNNGTVPVKLQDIIVDNPSLCITVSAWDGLGEQIEPGEVNDPPAMADNTIWFHVEQCALENQTNVYTFTVQFYYVQWNEYEP